MSNPIKDAYLWARGKRKTELGRKIDRTRDRVDDLQADVTRQGLVMRKRARDRTAGLRTFAWKVYGHIREFFLFLAGKKKTTYGRWLGLRWKAMSETLKAVIRVTRRTVKRAFKATVRALSPRRQKIRFERKWRKWREHRAMMGEESSVKRQLDLFVPGPRPVLVGPWISEVGFEALYWLPFLNWVTRHHSELERERIHVVSRGGAGPWYADIGRHYFDVFDLMDPATFAAKSEERREEAGGTHKHQQVSSLDREILEAARAHFDIPKARVCHPSLMYRLLNPVWYGWRPLRVLIDHSRYAPVRVPPPDPDWGLPDDYVAVKLYTAAATPDTPSNRELFKGVLRRLAARGHVVLLDTGMVVDDHEDFLFEGADRVHGIRHLMEPRNNLEIQTRVIRGARAFVGTCGSLAWLAPMLGVDTVALFEDPRFLNAHLYVAHRAYPGVEGAGAFLPVQTDGLRHLDPVGLMAGDRISR